MELTKEKFKHNGKIDKQTKSASMVSFFSPVIANLYMSYFEKRALNNVKTKPTLSKRYVDDDFTFWPPEQLQKFLTYLNNLNRQRPRPAPHKKANRQDWVYCIQKTHTYEYIPPCRFSPTPIT